MKRILSITLSLLLAFSLSACGGKAPAAEPEPEPSTSESSADDSAAQASEPSDTEENVPAEEAPAEDAEELPAEEPEKPDVQLSIVSGENSFSVVSGGETIVEFTVPTESPIYDSMKYTEGDDYAMMVHALMEGGISGRTIVEAGLGSCQDFADYYMNIVGIDEGTEPITKDLDGREVLIYKQEEQTVNMFGDEVCSFRYLVAVAVNEDVVLGFRIDGAYGIGKDIVFDDSTVDLLLSHCAF